MTHTDLQEIIIQRVARSTSPDWMIVRSLHEDCGDTDHLKFTLFDDWINKRELPFESHQGYVSFPDVSAKGLKNLLRAIYDRIADNDVAVASFWILVGRITMRSVEDVPQILKRIIPEAQRRRILRLLAASATENAFQESERLKMQYPECLKDWQSLIMYSERPEIDLAYSVAQLVTDGRFIDLDDLFVLPPAFIGALIGYRGLRLTLKADDAVTITDRSRLALLAAKALSYSFDKNYVPQWLSQALITKLVEDTSFPVGRELTADAWRPLQHKAVLPRQRAALMAYCKNAVIKVITGDVQIAQDWIDCLDPLRDLPVVLFLIARYRVSLSQEFLRDLALKFIHGLTSELQKLPLILSDTHTGRDLSSLQLTTPESVMAMTVLGSCLAEITDADIKTLKTLLFAIKPLFLGCYKAVNLALEATEMLLMPPLLGAIKYARQECMSEKIVDLISDFLLVPYVHIAERSEAIWNPDYETKPYDFDAQRLMLNHYLRVATSCGDTHPAGRLAKQLTDRIHDTATTPWPFERN